MKYIFTIMLAFVMSVTIAFAGNLPESTWQTYNKFTDTLTVYNGSTPDSGVFYQGPAAGYNGAATEFHEKWSNGFMPSYSYPVVATTTPAE